MFRMPASLGRHARILGFAALTALVSVGGSVPAAAAVLSPGDIIVVASNVIDVNPSSGNQTLITDGSIFTDARDVTVDPQGNILVTVGGTSVPPTVRAGLVQVDPAGNASLIATTTLGDPWGVAVAPTGLIYVATNDDLFGPGVSVVDRSRGLTRMVTSDGNFDFPNGLTIEQDGDLLVADPGLNGIIEVDPDTGAQNVVVTGGLLRSPQQIVLDENGDIVVSDTDLGALVRIDRQNPQQQTLVALPNIPDPRGLAVEIDGDYVFTATLNGALPLVGRLDRETGDVQVVSSGQFFNVTLAGATVVSPGVSGLQAKDTAQLGSPVRLHGTLECAGVERFRIRTTITDPDGSTGHDVDRGECGDRSEAWHVRVPSRPAGSFDPGRATVCMAAHSLHEGEHRDRLRECEPLRIVED